MLFSRVDEERSAVVPEVNAGASRSDQKPFPLLLLPWFDGLEQSSVVYKAEDILVFGENSKVFHQCYCCPVPRYWI